MGRFRRGIAAIKRWAAGSPSFLITLQKGYEGLRRVLYFFYTCLTPIDPSLIVLESYYGKAYACSPKALYEEMQRDPAFAGYRFVWAFQDIPGRDTLPQGPRTRLVTHDSHAYKKAMAAAQYYIANSMAPNYIRFRKGQTYVQTWHGTPLKRLGCDIEVDGNRVNTVREIHRRYQKRAARFDYMLSPSRFCTEKLISAFGLNRLHKESIVLETGYPRNDFLFRFTEADTVRIRARLGLPANKKMLLYAPTFRDNQTSGGVFTYRCPMDFESLSRTLGPDWLILFRAHYLIADHFDFSAYNGRVINVSAVDDINELYVISDALVTDYSSVFFDYANLHRPIFFYMYDLEEYRDSIRNFYIPLSVLPGPIVQTQEELEQKLKTLSAPFNRDETYRAFNQTFNYLDDADASHRTLVRIFALTGEKS